VIAGYFGGIIDDIVQYIYTTLSSIPGVLLIMAFMIIVGQGLPQLCIIMGITAWTGLCRVLRGETLKLREMEYVQSAEAMGVARWRILTRHIVPNVLHLVLISTVLAFSGNVMVEAALAFIGIGVGSDVYSWGGMINDARLELARDPVIWWKLSAAFFFMLGLVLPANIFGDAVRDALDPRLRTQ
jgi:peptide/nickel transport system permease protein